MHWWRHKGFWRQRTFTLIPWHASFILWWSSLNVWNVINLSPCIWRLLEFRCIALNVSNRYNMSSALCFNFINRLEWVCFSETLEFIISWLVNISCVYFVVRNICDSVLFQLCRSCFFNICNIHIIPSFKPFLLSVRSYLHSWDVLNVEFVCNKPIIFYCLFVFNWRL